jgi:hypothetical protein
MDMMKKLRAERMLADRYEQLGYVVTLEPPQSSIPFSVGSLRPNILATKGDENLLIDVKTAGARTDAESYLRLDQEVQRHRGWRLLLATVSDEEIQDSDSTFSGPAPIKSIQTRLRSMDTLIDDHRLSGLVLAGLWTAYVAALRIVISTDEVKIPDYTDLSLLNKTYSEGVISIDEYENARRLLGLRNKAIHSLESAVTPKDCKLLRALVTTLVDQLNALSTTTPRAQVQSQ